MSNPRIFNELSQSPQIVWSQISPGIDPGQWAAACRLIGQLPVKEFQRIVRQVRRARRKSLVRAFDRLMGDLGVGVEHPPAATESHRAVETPLVSIGPSGLGGPYQVEMRSVGT